MANHKVIQFRRGTTAQHASFAGAPGEVTVDTDKWTAVVHDGTTLGGFPLQKEATEYTRTRFLTFRAASVQQNIASLGFSSPKNQGPTAQVISEDSGILTGVASFEMGQSIQDHFMLPLDWVAPLELDILCRTQSTIGSVNWKLETCCVAPNGNLESITFNTPQFNTDIISGISYGLLTNTITINSNTFTPGSEVFFKLTRDNDTISNSLQLFSLRFSIKVLGK